jgi:hypothetical protein
MSRFLFLQQETIFLYLFKVLYCSKEHFVVVIYATPLFDSFFTSLNVRNIHIILNL